MNKQLKDMDKMPCNYYLSNNLAFSNITLVRYHEKRVMTLTNHIVVEIAKITQPRENERNQINTRQAKMSQIWLIIFVYIYNLGPLSSLI